MKSIHSLLLTTVLMMSFCMIPYADTINNVPGYAQIPVTFTFNEGQFHPEISFVVEGNGWGKVSSASGTGNMSIDVPLENNMTSIDFYGHETTVQIVPDDPAPWKCNYFIGNDSENWYSDVPTYYQMRQIDLYPGIDLLYTSNGRSIDIDLIVGAGVDPGQIMFSRQDKGVGTYTCSINENGELRVQVMGTTMDNPPPSAFQYIDDSEVSVETGYYFIDEENFIIGIEFGTYDPSYELILKPDMIGASYLGRRHYDLLDYPDAVETDDEGSAYVAGEIYIDCANDEVYGESRGFSAFYIMKLNPDGDAFDYITYIGSETQGVSTIGDMCVDTGHNVYIIIYNGVDDLPFTQQIINKSGGSGHDYLMKIGPNGNELVYSTRFGGSRADIVCEATIDTEGYIYVAGRSNSDDYPVTAGAFDTSYSGSCWFVSKFNKNGDEFIYSTYIDGGGSGNIDIIVDNDSNAYITGGTNSDEFPITPGSYNYEVNSQQISNYYNKVFITKINPDGSDLIYSTYFGGYYNDVPYDIALDNQGNAYVTGTTESDDFPITDISYDNSFNGGTYDVFIAKLSADGSDLLYSTYIGGDKNDKCYMLKVVDDNFYLAGYTDSSNFPTTDDAVNQVYIGDTDIFIMKFSIEENDIIYSSYYGGTSGDYGNKEFAFYDAKTFYLTGTARAGCLFDENQIFDYNWGFIAKFIIETDVYVEQDLENPQDFYVQQPFPNPFNPKTTITYYLPNDTFVDIGIYNSNGQKVERLFSGYKGTGLHTLTWDAANCASGLYFYRIKTNNSMQSGKMLLLR